MSILRESVDKIRPRIGTNKGGSRTDLLRILIASDDGVIDGVAAGGVLDDETSRAVDVDPTIVPGDIVSFDAVVTSGGMNAGGVPSGDNAGAPTGVIAHNRGAAHVDAITTVIGGGAVLNRVDGAQTKSHSRC